MYKNLFGVVGHRWISEYALTTLQNLPSCYITEVVFSSGKIVPIFEIKGSERNVSTVDIYFKDRNQDKSPYRIYVTHQVHVYPINWFFEDCRTRHRTPEDVEKRTILVSEQDLKMMRKNAHERIRNVLQLKEVSCESYEFPDIFLYLNHLQPGGYDRLCEFIKNADPEGVGVSIRLHINEANGDQLEKTLVDLAMVDAAMAEKS